MHIRTRDSTLITYLKLSLIINVGYFSSMHPCASNAHNIHNLKESNTIPLFNREELFRLDYLPEEARPTSLSLCKQWFSHRRCPLLMAYCPHITLKSQALPEPVRPAPNAVARSEAVLNAMIVCGSCSGLCFRVCNTHIHLLDALGPRSAAPLATWSSFFFVYTVTTR